ncbi:hypothetical protein TrCOL_g248 [Triparma columacea]|uniref:SURF1-like protein n=1 Tax=Triparma columacea TaxID=722753 RepID=A0A9W7FXD4_9STRA|nr:hypothetical protein TrCOL_g248 [Triparma columacea]
MSLLLGQIFFPALCLGTGGLGFWQSKRYFEKIEMIEKQEALLSAPPSSDLSSVDTSDGLSRRINLRGRYIHSKECVLGPRGPPPGALAQDGPMSGRGGGGLASSPQGFYVYTPLMLVDGGVVMVNRGWDSVSHENDSYNRPEGVVDLTAVTSSTEKGGMFSPPPISPFLKDNGRPQPTLLWLEEGAVRSVSGVDEAKEPRLRVFKEVARGGGGGGGGRRELVRPTAEQAVEFKVGPETHAGYAATWFSLSAAGVIMTRKLLRTAKV